MLMYIIWVDKKICLFLKANSFVYNQRNDCPESRIMNSLRESSKITNCLNCLWIMDIGDTCPLERQTPATIVVVVLRSTSSLGLRRGITMDRFCEGAPHRFLCRVRDARGPQFFSAAKCWKKEPCAVAVHESLRETFI